MVTPECAPAAKVGGLADVVHGLSKELAIRGNAVEIILPKYDCMRYDQIWGLTRCYSDLWVPFYQHGFCDVYFGWVDGLKLSSIAFGPQLFQSGCFLRSA
jgi:starch synthase